MFHIPINKFLPFILIITILKFIHVTLYSRRALRIKSLPKYKFVYFECCVFVFNFNNIVKNIKLSFNS